MLQARTIKAPIWEQYTYPDQRAQEEGEHMFYNAERRLGGVLPERRILKAVYLDSQI